MGAITRRMLLSVPAVGTLFDAAGWLDGETVRSSVEAGANRFRPSVSGREKIRRHYLPNLPLVTHEGKNVLFYEDLVKDKVVTINFFYSRCDEICPLVTANLVKVQKLLGNRVGRDIFMYSITLKPAEDTVEVIRGFREMHRIKPGWTFLTGAADDIELLRRKLGFTYPDPQIDRDKSQHIGNVRYGNEPMALWAACPGQANPKWIVESISWVERPTMKKTDRAIS